MTGLMPLQEEGGAPGLSLGRARTEREGRHLQARREFPPAPQSAGTLTVDFQPPGW